MIELDGTPNKAGSARTRCSASRWAGARARRRRPLLAAPAAALRGRARPGPAGADDEHPQRRRARRQQRGLPGVHGHAGRRAVVRRGRAHRRRDLPRAARHPEEEGLLDRRRRRRRLRAEPEVEPRRRSTSSSKRSARPATRPARTSVSRSTSRRASSGTRRQSLRVQEVRRADRDADEMVALYGTGSASTRSSRSRTASPRATGTAGNADHGARRAMQLVGDDLFVTNPEILERGINGEGRPTRSW